MRPRSLELFAGGSFDDTDQPPKADVIEQVIVCGAASREELVKGKSFLKLRVALRSSLSEVASHDLHSPVKASHPCAFVRFSSSKQVWGYLEGPGLVAAWVVGASKLEPHWAWSGACNPAVASLRSGLNPMWQALGPTTRQVVSLVDIAT